MLWAELLGVACREGGRETEEVDESRFFVPTAGRVEVPSIDEVAGEAVLGDRVRVGFGCVEFANTRWMCR